MRHPLSKLGLLVALTLIFGIGSPHRVHGAPGVPSCCGALPEDFKENPALNALIDREGINTGLSKGEALVYYRMDRIEEGEDPFGTSVGINTKVFYNGTARPGYVYLVQFIKDRIDLLAKSVATSEEGGHNVKSAKNAFVTSYGVPDAEDESDSDITLSYFIKHRDRYLLFQSTLTGDSEMDYRVYDLTSNVHVTHVAEEPKRETVCAILAFSEVEQAVGICVQ